MKIKLNFTTIVTFFIVASPMFIQYQAIGIPFLLLPEPILMCLILISFLYKQKISLSKFKLLFIYIFVAIFTTCITYFIQPTLSLNTTITTLIRFIFYCFCIMILSQNFFNMKLGMKISVYIGSLNSLYVIIQYLFFEIFNKTLPWYIKFFSISQGSKLIENSEYYFKTFGFRASGLFSEPAHFAQYTFLPLFFLLFMKFEDFHIRKYKNILIILLSISLIISKSGTSYIVLILCFGFKLISVFQKSNTKNKMTKSLFSFIFMILISITGFFAIIQNENLNGGLIRMLNTSEQSSKSIRINRGVSVYTQLPFKYKIIGVGYGNYGDYVERNNVVTIYDYGDENTWSNTIIYILVGTGIIGLISYLLFYIDLLIHTKNIYRYLSLSLLIFAFFTVVPLSIMFVVFSSFILYGYKGDKANERKLFTYKKQKRLYRV